MSIKNNMKKIIFDILCKKKHLEKSKTYKKYIGKSVFFLK